MRYANPLLFSFLFFIGLLFTPACNNESPSTEPPHQAVSPGLPPAEVLDPDKENVRSERMKVEKEKERQEMLDRAE